MAFLDSTGLSALWSRIQELLVSGKNFVGTFEGNASTSSKLETPRLITIKSGEYTYSKQFDGSQNIEIDLTTLATETFDLDKVKEAIGVFEGATNDYDGKAGLVPPPSLEVLDAMD